VYVGVFFFFQAEDGIRDPLVTGVQTCALPILIIVMSVMNGFRADLLGRILGLNGHLGVYAASGSLGDFDAAAEKVSEIPGITGEIGRASCRERVESSVWAVDDEEEGRR